MSATPSLAGSLRLKFPCVLFEYVLFPVGFRPRSTAEGKLGHLIPDRDPRIAIENASFLLIRTDLDHGIED